MNLDVRCQQRLHNFEKALALLKEVKTLDLLQLSLLEKEGVIQRFEYTLELARKTLKDKMEFDGLMIDRISPKVVLKEAYQNKYINHIEIWLQMINDRNLLSHTYDIKVFEEVILAIQSEYIKLLEELQKSLNS